MAMSASCQAKMSHLVAMMGSQAKYNPLAGKTGISPDSIWRTVNNHAIQMVGAGTPELNADGFFGLYNRVQRYGEAGWQISDMVRRAHEMIRINSSMYETRALEIVKPLKTKEEWLNLRELPEQRSSAGLVPGQKKPPVGSTAIQPLNDNVAFAARMLDSAEGSGGLMDHLFTIVEKEGISEQRLKNYWPIIYPTEMLEDLGFKSEAVKSFAREQAQLRIANEKNLKPSQVRVTDADVTGQDRVNAQNVFNRYVLPQYAAVAPHLELKREWDVAGQIDDPNVLLPIYIRQLWRRIAEKRIFGDRDHLHDLPATAKGLIGQIESTHGSAAADEAMMLVRDLVGITPSDPTMNNAITKTLGNIQGLKLTASQLRNLTQQANAAMRGDAPSLIKAWGLYIADGEVNGYNVRELARDIGATTDMALYESTLYHGSDRLGKMVEGVLKWTGFTPMEKLNRIASGVAGAVYADKQARRLVESTPGGWWYRRAEERLKELGISPDVVRDNGGISTTDMLLAGRRFIDETQFGTRAGELPLFAQSGLGRFALQFRTFTLNQTKFFIREMQRRPARALMFGMGVMPAVGFASTVMQDVATELLPWFEPRTHPERSGYAAALESWAAAGSFGIVSDLSWAVYQSGDTKMFANYFTPPIVGTANDVLAIAGELGRGKGKAAFRDFTRQFGGLGAAFGRYVAPPRAKTGQSSSFEELDELAEWIGIGQ